METEEERERKRDRRGESDRRILVVDSVPCVEYPTRESGWARMAQSG